MLKKSIIFYKCKEKLKIPKVKKKIADIKHVSFWSIIMILNLTDEEFDLELKKLLENVDSIKADVDLYSSLVEEKINSELA